MTRRTVNSSPAHVDLVQKMYHKALRGWAWDLMTQKPVARWPEPSADADVLDRDWHQLYAGSVLDD